MARISDERSPAGEVSALADPGVSHAPAVEQHGYDFIREEDRYLRPRSLFSFWWGANITVIYMVAGAIVISLGLSLWESALIIVAGTFGFLAIGYASVSGPRTGLPTMTFTRAAFGVRGNRFNAFLAWLVQIGAECLNAVLIVLALQAMAAELGWHNPGKGGTAAFVIIAMLIPALIAIYGHKLLFLAQKWIAIALSVVLVLVACFTVGKINWSFPATVHGTGPHIGALLLGLAVVVANPLSYANVAGDYARYLPSKTSAKAVAWWTFAGVGIISVLLELLGAGIFTRAPGIGADPISGFRALIPGWLYVIFIINGFFGAAANNAITFYSSGLTMQSMGMPLHRWRATLIDFVLSTVIVLYIELFDQSLQSVFADYLAFLNVWAAPFFAVYLTDAILRRWRFDPAGIHTVSAESPYWGRSGLNVAGIVSMLAGMGVGFLTVHAPVYVSPLASALWGGDISWLAPFAVSCALYWLLAAPSLRETTAITRASDPAAQ